MSAAAYRAGLLMLNSTTGARYDYRRRRGVLKTRCFAPQDAAWWATYPQRLWQEVSNKEKRKDSQEAREFEISLPHELTDEQRCELAWDICRDLIDRYGFAIQASVHKPPTNGGLNWHLHALATTRRVRADGLAEKVNELSDWASRKSELEWVRERVAARINERLADGGYTARVDHRSLENQMLAALDNGDMELAAELAAREPTKPLGKSATAMQRRGSSCRLADENDAIRMHNAMRHAALRQRLVEEGHLPPLSTSRTIRSGLGGGGAAMDLGNGSGSIGSIHGLGSVTDLRTPAQRRRDKQAETAEQLADAAKLWAEDFVDTIGQAFSATRKFMAYQAERAAAFVHRPNFRADVRAFVHCLKRLKRDATRFRRRMEQMEQAGRLLSSAEAELRRFDDDNPRPGLWSKRSWQMRRARRLQAVAQRERSFRKATEATGPEAQTDYLRRARETGAKLEQMSISLLSHYPVPADHPATDHAVAYEAPGPGPRTTQGPRM